MRTRKKSRQRTRKSWHPRITQKNAPGLVHLMETAARYLGHEEVKQIHGRELAFRAEAALLEAAGYVQDHVLSYEEKEPLSRHDEGLIADALVEGARLLGHGRVAIIPFALRSTAVADRLRQAARNIRK